MLPSGNFASRDGRGPYRVENAAAVIEASRRYAGSRQIPIDYEHQTMKAANNGQPAPAAGWIDALQARTDGIWGRVNWTKRAAEFLARREYRYFSPTFLHAPDGTIASIINGALTNTPALPQLLALARAETSTMDPNTPTNPPETLLSGLRTLLRLSDTADEAAILAAIRDLIAASAQSASVDPGQFVPIGVLEATVAEVNRLNQGVSLQIATTHVEHQIRAGNLPPALKAWGVQLCSVNKVAFDAFVERTKGGFNTLIEGQFGARAAMPAGGASSRLTDDERAVCSRMAITEDEFLKARAFNGTTKG